jgi:hypothetical protein
LASPTTTIGSQFVGNWSSIPAHWHNTANPSAGTPSRQYVPGATALTSQPTKIEFIPLAGLRIQGWAFFANITEGDFWNFGNSTRKPPGGLVAAFYMPNDDDATNDFNAVRCTRPDLIEFNGLGVTGSGWVITVSRGTTTRGGSHPTGTGGGSNISPQQASVNAPPDGSVPLQYRIADRFNANPVLGYIATGTPLIESSGNQQIAFAPAESLRWSCYYFAAINNGNTWTSADTVMPPKGIVTAAWMPDTNSAGGDIVNVRVESANSIRFRTGGVGRNGWLLVGCRG